MIRKDRRPCAPNMLRKYIDNGMVMTANRCSMMRMSHPKATPPSPGKNPENFVNGLTMRPLSMVSFFYRLCGYCGSCRPLVFNSVPLTPVSQRVQFLAAESDINPDGPSPASSSELSPEAKHIMDDVRTKRKRIHQHAAKPRSGMGRGVLR